VYIGDHENAYRSFLDRNRAFWLENTRYASDNDECLYVDLSHDNPSYLATNLWIAKYIQRIHGGRLIGLAHGWLRACPHYNFERVRDLAHSFVVDTVIDLDAETSDDSDAIARFQAAVSGLSGAELRHAILKFNANEDPDIGWILYDTWLRQERRATIESVEPGLLECARTALRVRRSIVRTMQNAKTAGAVVGHYHYSPYSFVALEALRQAAPVYFQSLLIPVSIRRFSSIDDLRRGRAADFFDAYEREIVPRSEPERLASFGRRMFDVQSSVREFFRAVLDPATDDRTEDILHRYGLDPKLPVACFYVPALCGAPHCFGPIAFDDFGDWLRRSLDAALKMPHVNFLVKRHPQDAVYDTGNFVGRLHAVYGAAPNIRFLSDDTPSGAVAAICDVVVTVSGTSGYDMAVRGVATVAAGRSRYSGLRFALEPADLIEYEALLARAGEYKLTPEQRRRALIFAYFELGLGRSVSLFLAPVRLAGTAEFWQESERNLTARFIEEDPLYRNVRHMLAENLPFLLNTDLAFAE
jgi:hypothetical protein